MALPKELARQLIKGTAKPTPAGKMAWVNAKLGNESIKYQQGTTRMIFDSILIAGQTNYKFFEDAKSRSFPFTNVSGGAAGVLGVGESLAIENMYIFIAQATAGTEDFIAITDFSAMDFNFQMSTMEMLIANKKVIKSIPLNSMLSANNKNAYFDGYNNFEFDTDLIVPPLLELELDLRLPDGVTAVADSYLFVVLTGNGAIISPDTTL